MRLIMRHDVARSLYTRLFPRKWTSLLRQLLQGCGTILRRKGRWRSQEAMLSDAGAQRGTDTCFGKRKENHVAVVVEETPSFQNKDKNNQQSKYELHKDLAPEKK